MAIYRIAGFSPSAGGGGSSWELLVLGELVAAQSSCVSKRGLGGVCAEFRDQAVCRDAIRHPLLRHTWRVRAKPFGEDGFGHYTQGTCVSVGDVGQRCSEALRERRRRYFGSSRFRSKPSSRGIAQPFRRVLAMATKEIVHAFKWHRAFAKLKASPKEVDPLTRYTNFTLGHVWEKFDCQTTLLAKEVTPAFDEEEPGAFRSRARLDAHRAALPGEAAEQPVGEVRASACATAWRKRGCGCTSRWRKGALDLEKKALRERRKEMRRRTSSSVQKDGGTSSTELPDGFQCPPAGSRDDRGPAGFHTDGEMSSTKNSFH